MSNGNAAQVWHDVTSTLRVGLRSTVAKNATSLYIIQFAQYILPLITVPYLVRVLEPSGYGLVAFCQSFIAYFIILTDFGVHFYRPQERSHWRGRISRPSAGPHPMSGHLKRFWRQQALYCF